MKQFVSIFLFLLSVLCLSQDPFYKTFSSQDGLSTNSIYNIAEDKDGRIWLGTESGLFYYDGRRFNKIENTAESNPNIFNLQIDSDGIIWCTDIGGNIYNVRNNKLELYINLTKQLDGTFQTLVVFEDELIVLSEKVALSVQKDNHKQIEELNFRANKIATTQKGIIVYDFKSNLYLIQEENGNAKITGLDYNKEKDRFRNLNVRIYTIQDYIFGSTVDSDGIYTHYPIGNLSHGSKPDFSLNSIKAWIYNTKTIENESWVLTDKGAFIYTENSKNPRNILADYHVTDIIKDTNQNIWLSTLNNGVLVVPNLGITKTIFDEKLGDIVSIIEISDKQLILGTQKGELIDYNTKDGTFNILTVPNERTVNNLVYNPTLGVVYVSTNSQSSYVYQLSTKSIKSANGLFAVAKGFAFISPDSLVYLNYREAAIYTNINQNSNTITLKQKRPVDVFYDKKTKLLYITYFDSTVIYDKNLSPTELKYKNKSISLYNFVQTSDNKIWVRNKDKVLAIDKYQIIDSLTCKDGLINAKVKGLVTDKEMLYIVTSKGIQRHNTLTQTIQTVEIDDKGSNKLKWPIIHNNNMYIPGNSFLSVVDLKKINFKQSVSLSEAAIDHVSINNIDVVNKDAYNLPYNHNSITFKFNAHGFESSKRNVYQYRLLGLDKDWQTTDVGDYSVRYASIPSGNYTFQLRTKNLIGDVSKQISSVKIYVAKPFWIKKWFIAIAFIGMALLIISYYRYVIYIREKKNRDKLEKAILNSKLSETKLENLRSQMNPHFIFNSLNSVQELVLSHDIKNSNKYLGHFGELLRRILTSSKKQYISLEEETEIIRLYLDLEKLRFGDDFEVVLECSIPKAKQESIKVPSMVVQPYVENAIKHGLFHKSGKKILKIAFKILNNSTLICEIEDNGIGRKKAEFYKRKRVNRNAGFSSEATFERIRLLNQTLKEKIKIEIIDLQDENKPAGTKIILYIPI